MPHEKGPSATGEQTQAAASWAVRLAKQQHQREPDIHEDNADALLSEATASLWLPLDTAVREANQALEMAGEVARISITKTNHERQYGTTGPDGSVRTISVYLVLSVVEYHLSGGAYISTNRSRLSMYLVPASIDSRLQWFVASSGRAFESEIVQDLFLMVFADDPGATHRLSPLSGSDLFDTPWT